MNSDKPAAAILADHLRQHLDVPVYVDGVLTADDGTEWMYSPGLDLWTGWAPGEDGCWTMAPEEFAKVYPEVERQGVEQ